MLVDKALEALLIVADPERLLFIMIGAVAGLIIGVIPGIGGLVGLALLLPFTYGLDPLTAMALLMGLIAVTPTSDTIPSILFGVPGSVGAAATVMDGYPMAQRGEAGRALGASFTASAIGGLFGAMLLMVSVPILRPVMLAIGTPELLAICILGLTLVAALSRGSILKGLAVVCFGVLLASVGDEEQTGRMRWTFDLLYLMDGIPLVAIALGLFALPELFDMAVARRSVAGNSPMTANRWQQLEGVKDVMKNLPVVFRSSALGSVLGAMPGIGGAVIDWVAYGMAAKTSKGAAQTFGTGDVRGVIASESSNNAKDGGALIPTLAFAVPGSASMALVIGAFMMHGIQPGPKMLDENATITYTLVWSLAIANIIGAGLCFLFAHQLAKLATVRPGVLVPAVIAITVIGAFQGARDFGDLIVLFGFGLTGWIMKRFGWPRPPLILGLVLGRLIENYLFISVTRYQFEWLARPGVVVIFSVLLFILARPAWAFLKSYRANKAAEVSVTTAVEKPPADYPAAVLWISIFALFAYALVSSWTWGLSARLMPATAAVVGLLVVGARLIQMALPPSQVGYAGLKVDTTDILADLPRNEMWRRFLIQCAWVLGLLIGVRLIGMLPAIAVFMVTYMVYFGGARWRTALMITVPMWIIMLMLFDNVLHIPWPDSVLGDLWPRPVPGFIRRLL